MKLDDFADSLLAAAPVLTEDVALARERWSGHPPPTLLMSTIGKAYAREAGSMSERTKRMFFASVEEALREEDSLVGDAVATGLLEAVLSEAERGGLNRAALIDRFVGPKARESIRAWDEFPG